MTKGVLNSSVMLLALPLAVCILIEGIARLAFRSVGFVFAKLCQMSTAKSYSSDAIGRLFSDLIFMLQMACKGLFFSWRWKDAIFPARAIFSESERVFAPNSPQQIFSPPGEKMDGPVLGKQQNSPIKTNQEDAQIDTPISRPPSPPKEREIQNQTTFLFGVNLESVYQSWVFISESGHGFDVTELVDMMNSQNRLYNPYTKQEFTEGDLEKLKEFPQINRHFIFQRIVNPEAARAYEMEIYTIVRNISKETEGEIEKLERVLRKEHNPGQVEPDQIEKVLQEKGAAVLVFKEYFDRLSPKEREALIEISMKNTFLYMTNIVEEIEDLIKGGCSAGTNQYFKQILDLLAIGRSAVTSKEPGETK